MDYFERKLDDKNRLTIPAELRGEFEGKNVIITPGFKNYLHMYTEKTWNTEMEAALKGSIVSEELADLNDKFRSGKTISAMDAKQGRIIIEQHLLRHAGLGKGQEVVAVRIATEGGSYWRLRQPIKIN